MMKQNHADRVRSVLANCRVPASDAALLARLSRTAPFPKDVFSSQLAALVAKNEVAVVFGRRTDGTWKLYARGYWLKSIGPLPDGWEVFTRAKRMAHAAKFLREHGHKLIHINSKEAKKMKWERQD